MTKTWSVAALVLSLLAVSAFAADPVPAKLQATRNVTTLAPASNYVDAVTVKSTDAAGAPLPSIPVKVAVTKGDAKVYTDGVAVGTSIPITTDAQGSKSFSILTGKDTTLELTFTPTPGDALVMALPQKTVVLKVDQKVSTFNVSSNYANAVVITAVEDLKVDPLVPVAKVPIDIIVASGDAKVYAKGTQVSDKIRIVTDDHGVANFSIITGSSDTGFAIDAVPFSGTTAITTEIAHLDLSTVPKYKDALSSNRAYAQLFMGQTFANNYNDAGDNTGFGSAGQQIALTFDTMWKRPPTWPSANNPQAKRPFGLIHTELYMAFNQFPFGVAAAPAADGKPATDAKAAPLENAFTGTLGLIWQPDWWASYSKTSRDEDLQYDAFRWGLFTRAGFTTRGKKATNGDSAIGRAQLGVRFTHHHTKAATPQDEDINYVPVRFVEVSYALYEQFQGRKNHGLLIVDGGIRLTPLSNNVVPFYAGFHAAVGPGPDDVRVVAGFLFKLDKLAELIKSSEGEK